MKLRIKKVFRSALLLCAAGLASCASSASPTVPESDGEILGSWTLTRQTALADGVFYSRYRLGRLDSRVHVLSLDLSNPRIVLETVMADEICPNPNRNFNANNGKNLRETLSETCLRRRSEGRNIIAGVNTGFFNSHDGFPRGFHIEYDEPLFINSPYVRDHLPNHRYGFTFFSDRRCSFEERSFEGTVQWNGITIPYYSINDTILMQRGPAPAGYLHTQQANLYTFRFRHTPHEERPEITNEINPDALFIVARSDRRLQVNCGETNGRIIGVIDGREGRNIEIPYVTQPNEWVLRLTGEEAARMASAAVGDPVRITATVRIGGEAKSIIMHNAGMARYLHNGMQIDRNTERKPATTIGIDAQGIHLMIVCVDGVSSSGSGMNYDQLGAVMKHLGMAEAVRFDGGGSTSMWIYEEEKGGLLACPSCDSKGDERSCMNYLHVRILE